MSHKRNKPDPPEPKRGKFGTGGKAGRSPRRDQGTEAKRPLRGFGQSPVRRKPPKDKQ